MSSSREKELKSKIKIIILAFLGVIIFVIAIITNTIGMSQTINKEPDRSGLAGFSIRKTDSDSLGNKKELKVDDNGKIAETDILVNSLPIIKLNNNRWDKTKVKFSEYELDENENMVFSDGYVIYSSGKMINNIVFDSTYTDEVIGHLKVGEDFKTIEKTLGIPSFKTKSYLGYKTKEDYVFFYKDEISVYPNITMSNSDIEELFESYLNKTYGKERTYLLVDIRNDYPDFTIEMDEETNTVILTSVLRQMIVKLDNLGGINVELYNGYEVANESTNKYIKQKIYSTNEEDLVEIIENERVSGK